MNANSSKFIEAITYALLFIARINASAAGDLPPILWQTNAHGEPIRSVGFSGNGALVESGAGDAFLLTWRVADWSLVRAIDPLANGYAKVSAAAFSPDSSLLAVGDDSDVTRVWNLASGTKLWSVGSDPGYVYSLAFSSDGRLLAMGRAEFLSIVDTISHNEQHLEEGKTVTVAFSQDGTLLATAIQDPWPSHSVEILRTNGFALLHRLTGHTQAVYSVDFSPDGQLLLTTSLDGTARLWRVSDGSVVRVIEGGGGVFGKFSADGKTFFTCDGSGTVDFLPGSGTIKFWRTSNGALLASFDNLNAGPIAVSPAGKYFAYGKGDGTLVVAYVPLWIESISHQGSEVTLRWQGGTGNYQVQARDNAVSGVWQNLGAPTTNTVFTHTCLAPMFYRVQSLTNAP